MERETTAAGTDLDAVAEAGGVATDLRGQPWLPGSRDIAAAAPGVHAALLDALRAVA
jgi:myo-inositol-1(or 4)-monophosphatase